MISLTYQQALNNQAIKWTYLERVLLFEINIKKGLANQARLFNALNDDLVSEYTQAYKDKVQFPPLVLVKLGSKYNVLDGNHRIAAAIKAGLKEHDAYIVHCEDSMVLDRIAWSFNNHVNGLRLTREECVAHAVSFVRKYGASAKDAASEWKVPEWLVRKEVKAEELREVLHKNKINDSKLTKDMLNAMSPLQTLGEDIFIPIAQTAIESGATGSDIKEIVEKIKSKKTHQEKISEVQTYVASSEVAERKAETKAGAIKRRSPLPRERLQKLVNEIIRLLENYPDRKAFLSTNKETTKELRQLSADLINKLTITLGLGTTIDF